MSGVLSSLVPVLSQKSASRPQSKQHVGYRCEACQPGVSFLQVLTGHKQREHGGQQCKLIVCNSRCKSHKKREHVGHGVSYVDLQSARFRCRDNG